MNHIKLFDGAMGTMLQQAGLAAGACPELVNIENPSSITSIHRAYVESGAQIIETNTFGANRIKLRHYGLDDKVMLLNTAAVQAARAAGQNVQVAGSVGPTGKLLAPLGDLNFDYAYDVFCEQISALISAGVDYILIETIIDIQEMRAALLAAKSTTSLPVICQLTFGSDGRTVTGTDARTAAYILEGMGANIIGANCSLGPAQLLPIIEQLANSTTCPIIVQPNAGMPELINGETVFPMNAAEFASWASKLITAGATYLGGCCGTTPAHIKAVKESISSLTIPERTKILLPGTALTSRSKTVYIGAGLPTAIIGERINPTGRKALSEEIANGVFTRVKQEALAQIRSGAQILDVNMGVPGIDQTTAMTEAIIQLSMLVDAPLAIDTSDEHALEAGLRHYPGRALINSVTAEPDRIEKFLPLAKKYGAAILCLPISPQGIPATAAERVKVVKQIISHALEAGLKEQDFVLDALILTVAADARAANEALLTLKLYRDHFGYPTTMGLSNISYGLPNREIINSTFCAMALAAGLDAPILNPHNTMMQQTLAAANALLGYDENGQNYSLNYNPSKHTSQQPITPLKPIDTLAGIRQAVIDGNKEETMLGVRQALAEGHNTTELTENGLTAAMNEVGEAFGTGRCFLPQVLLAAEAMKCAFSVIKEVLPNEAAASIGTVVLATVKGDIHDLGKNIVAALMENSRMKIIDLGKDVPAEEIVAAVKEHKASVVGLCALMTTTIPQIDFTISQLKAAGCKVATIVGGAVVTADYAAKAGADYYAPDAVTAVNQAKKIFIR